ncbi:DUF6035 family protein [Endozoicomonas sp. ALB115]|uniref:DUF6035 family protein n=1 Tax=Endozoicomonas sp. ALB115 TaxID=3403074 RepID=UPI003BB696B0
MSKLYTVEEVLDLKTGNIYPADYYLLRGQYYLDNLREELEISLQSKESPGTLVCSKCLQKLKVRRDIVMKNGQPRKAHFAHYQDIDNDCPYKTDRHFSKEEMRLMTFANVKESDAHKQMKYRLRHALSVDLEFEDIKQEEHIKATEDKNFRRPDVSAFYDSQKVVFEVQLTTTFLDVIVGRNEFYRKENIQILWVFQRFNPESTVQTENDIFNTNKTNAFVFDEEAYNLSIQQKKLHFWCYYLRPYLSGAKIHEVWEKQMVTFDQLNVDDKKTRLYYFDYDQAMDLLKADLNAAIIREEFHDYFCNIRQISDVNLQPRDIEIFQKLKGYTGLDATVYDTQFGKKLDRNLVWLLTLLYSAKLGSRVQGRSNLKTLTAQVFISPALHQFFHAYAYLCNYYNHDFHHKTYRERREELRKELAPAKQNRRYDPIIKFLFPELIQTKYFSE